MWAFLESLQPLLAGFALAVILGVPLGVLIGRFRSVEAAIGIYITAGYAMPLVALVPLYIMWFGLGFAVKVAIMVFAVAITALLAWAEHKIAPWHDEVTRQE